MTSPAAGVASENRGTPIPPPETALDKAVFNPHAQEIVKNLLALKMNPTQPANGKFGTLDFAIVGDCDHDTLEKLVQAGATATVKTLDLAKERYFHPDAIKILQGAIDYSRELRIALTDGKDLQEITGLLDVGAKPEQPNDKPGAFGDLDRAVRNLKCSPDVITVLIERGAKPLLPGEQQPGTLANAIHQKRPEAILHLLIGAGARLGSRDYLVLAQETGYSQVTLDLLETALPPEEGGRGGTVRAGALDARTAAPQQNQVVNAAVGAAQPQLPAPAADSAPQAQPAGAQNPPGPVVVAQPEQPAQAPVAAAEQQPINPPANAAPQPSRSFFGCLCAPFVWFFRGIGSIFSAICGGIAALFSNPPSNENE